MKSFLLKRKGFLIVFAAISFIAALFIQKTYHHTAANISTHRDQIQIRLHSLEDRLLLRINDEAITSFIEGTLQFKKLENEPYSLFVYLNDSLIYWNDNSIVPIQLASDIPVEPTLYKLNNGIYELVKREMLDPNSNDSTGDHYSVVGVIPIKYAYKYTNEFLINSFHEYYGVPQWVDLTFDESHDLQVQSVEGNFLFSVKTKPAAPHIKSQGSIVMFLYLLAMLLIISFVSFIFLSINFGNNWWLYILSWIAFLFVARYVMIYFHIPDGLYASKLFDPQLYGSSFWLHSLGDLFLNLILFLSLIVIIVPRITSFISRSSLLRTSYGSIGLILLLTFSILTIVDFAGHITEGLILNSQISFNINNFFSLDEFSIAGLFILGLTLGGIYWILHHLFYSLKKLRISVITRTYGFVGGGILFIGVHLLLKASGLGHEVDLFAAGWAMILLILFLFMLPARLSFLHTMGLILYFAIFSAYQIVHANDIKEEGTRKSLVQKLGVESDPIAESLLPGIRQKLIEDPFIQNYFANPLTPKNTFLERVERLYFGGYFKKYDIDIRLFSESIISWEQPKNYSGPFTEIAGVSIAEQTSMGDGFKRYLAVQSPRSGYILEIPISFKGSFIGRLVIQLTHKILQKPKFYPNLLLDESIMEGAEYEDYAYAIYINDQLISTKGDYPYSFKPPVLANNDKEFFNFVTASYEHLVYQAPTSKTIILSRKKEDSMLKFITIVSYLFFFVLFLVLAFILMARVVQFIYSVISGKQQPTTIPLLFRTRTQMAMIALILISFIMVGWRTFINFKSETNQYHQGRLLRKVRAVSTDFQYEVSKRGAPFIKTDEVHLFVSQLSDVHSIDVNLYDLKGDLITTSQPDIVDKGLTSEKINPEAFDVIRRNMSTKFVQNEHIGKFNYLAAYVPITIGEENIKAILSLPYYAKEKDLQREIEGLMVNLINVYGLLFVIGSFLAIFLAYPVTSSITMIIDKFKMIKIGKKNELIDWHSDDELGGLVNEYNKMIKALEESASMLAKSERESAWREMARQVAHEIKNPLTPMKLSIQHLQKASQKDDPNLKKLIKDMSATLIEQIDNLSYIASEFQDFANMPRANNEHFAITQVLEHVTDLFKKNEQVNLSIVLPKDKSYQVYCDRIQLSRVFTNLLQNAVQSIPEERQGEVKVALKEKDKSILVEIADNGSGIAPDIEKRVFEPNFTTKSSGMGLGLAMTKNIIEQANGSIWFESEIGVGTTFYIQLPLSNGKLDKKPT